jgi:hypothetical protein
MAKTYFAYNGPRVTTAAPVSVTTGTAIKTLMQLSTPSTEDLKVVEWGISFDGTSGTPIKCELVETGAIAATVTAFGANDITCGTSRTTRFAADVRNYSVGLHRFSRGHHHGDENAGFAACFACRLSYVKQFPLGREPVVPSSKFLRMRVTAPVAVNAYCFIVWEE